LPDYAGIKAGANPPAERTLETRIMVPINKEPRHCAGNAEVVAWPWSDCTRAQDDPLMTATFS
jgi:hypothetical protein